LAGALILGVLLLPSGISLFQQMRAGRILDQLLSSNAAERKDTFACELAPLTEKRDRQRLRIALRRLQAAQRANASASHTYLLLGRVNCLLGEPEKAANAFLKYTQLRPENPMGYLELGFAYKALCNLGPAALDPASAGINPSNSACETDQVNHLISTTWAEAGVNVDSFFTTAETAFIARAYAEAEHWYRYSHEYGIPQSEELRNPTLFKWAVSAVIAGQPLPDGFRQSFSVIPLLGNVTIEEDTLYWMRDNPPRNLFYGDPLSKLPSPDPEAGVLFWNGAVVSFVNVVNPGLYTITVRAKHTEPAPILLQTELNLAPLGQISLEKEDNSWEEFSIETRLNSGLNLIGVRFLNNASVDGKDRNAYIDWIRVEEAARP